MNHPCNQFAQASGCRVQPSRTGRGDFRDDRASVSSMTIRLPRRSRAVFRGADASARSGFPWAASSTVVPPITLLGFPCFPAPKSLIRLLKLPDQVRAIPCSNSLLWTTRQPQKPNPVGICAIRCRFLIRESLCSRALERPAKRRARQRQRVEIKGSCPPDAANARSGRHSPPAAPSRIRHKSCKV